MGKSTTTRNSREWTQIYAIYGMDQWQTLIFLLAQAILFSVFSILYLLYFTSICIFFELILPSGAARFAAGFTGVVTVLSAVCLYFAAANFFYSAVPLQYDMANRIVSAVSDWSSVKLALDLGCCGRGILLTAVAMQLKKEGSSGRVVGLERWKQTTLSTLRTAVTEGVGEYVTCRDGDARRLPFRDNYFDVVVSGVFVHTVGVGRRSAAEAAAERMRAVGEVVRVMKPGGVGVVWDLLHVPEYVTRLKELNMEDVRVSECVTAFMVSSHIVSFRKPTQQYLLAPPEVTLDWRLC
ncbi:putative S-adenosyl-L-methionine-dependent methyltransferase [Lupinus albus]|uniref:Putative S-adenosyl-L-methionine-dependent methyltransferase n=1 Tax=Lupinus albus TaxID=3870 RepID=A0A6A4MM61_LUPAL|nr:putative S-adenosyl-L-methionine-dependent methyltransferase [Lupinus albus]